MTIRLAHTWSSDLGIPWTAPYSAPLLERGWEIWNITPPGPHASAAQAAGGHWLPLDLSRSMNLLRDAKGVGQLWRYFNRERFDIVHTHAIKVGLVGRVVAAAARIPIIVHTLHGLAYSLETPRPKRFAHAALERIANLRVDAILAQAHEDADTLVATGTIPAEKVVWVGNGIDLGRYRPDAISEDERTATRAALGISRADVLFLTAGRLVREKGIVELCDAAVEIRHTHPEIRLAIAGNIDREKADALDGRFVESMREAGVLFLGSRNDMPALYAAADVVVLASWREGMPRVLMEGAAMGKPLLASNARGCREIVRPPRNGLLVPARDSRAMAEAMAVLAENAPLRERLGRENAVEARGLYDVHQVAQRVVAVYDRLLAERGIAARGR